MCLTGLVIQALLCASLGDTCLEVFRRRNPKDLTYDKRQIKTLPVNLSSFVEAFRKISKPCFHAVDMDIIVDNKTLKRQLTVFRRLYQAENCE